MTFLHGRNCTGQGTKHSPNNVDETFAAIEKCLLDSGPVNNARETPSQRRRPESKTLSRRARDTVNLHINCQKRLVKKNCLRAQNLHTPTFALWYVFFHAICSSVARSWNQPVCGRRQRTPGTSATETVLVPARSLTKSSHVPKTSPMDARMT